MKLSSGQKICTLPFESVEVNSNGKLYFCCASWQKKPFGDLNKDSILSEWNSLAAKEIRQSILDGSYKFCNKDMCPYLQTNCLKEYNELTEIQQKLVSEQGIDAPISLMLNYDYSCNLSCPSCRYEKVSITSTDQEFPFLKSLTEKIVFDFFQNSSQRKIKLNITVRTKNKESLPNAEFSRFKPCFHHNLEERDQKTKKIIIIIELFLSFFFD